jgi:hypothetical protein
VSPPDGPLRGFPDSPDDLLLQQRRRAFEAAHPDVTITPPETHASMWTARQFGSILASDYQLGALLGTLEWLLGEGGQPVLTIQPPWSWAAVHGVRDVEQRTWTTRLRGRLWIHSAQTEDLDAPSWTWPPAGEDWPRGVMLGYVTLTDVTGTRGDWTWHFTDPAFLADPIPMRGWPWLWRWDPPPGLQVRTPGR